ncbi:hypothetical protein FHX34_104715 [Actinoplanes teichomyceticus]|uniref:Uncharacterized protein n=1 Tax=Actinoplanes teichomyceticus TaxID=1867 RepID=A0A561VS04_ACTTI|nr:hypothetical protein FHX34_104715 [Actinoplanes teichomyceticus]
MAGSLPAMTASGHAAMDRYGSSAGNAPNGPGTGVYRPLHCDYCCASIPF